MMNRVPNSLDPDQAQHVVGPDLGPNCLQLKASSRRQKLSPVKLSFYFSQITP